MYLRKTLLVSAAVLAVTACATPQQRLLAQQGGIALGMPEAQVRTALGSPDSVTAEAGGGQAREIWHYTREEYENLYPYRRPSPRDYNPGYWQPYPSYEAYPTPVRTEWLRVVFGPDGRVEQVESAG